MSQVDYSTVAHEVIYQQIMSGPGYRVVTETQERWDRLADTLSGLNEGFAATVKSVFEVQRGTSADAVHDALMRLVPWAEQASEAAKQQAERAMRQADAFLYVQTMPPPIPRVVPGSPLAPVLIPSPESIATYNAPSVEAEAQARRMMTEYQAISNDLVSVPIPVELPPLVTASDAPAGGPGGPGGAGGGGGGAVSAGGAAVPSMGGQGGAPVAVSAQSAAPPPPAHTPVAPAASAGQFPGGPGGGYTAQPDGARPVPVAPAAAAGGVAPGRGAGGGGGGGRAGGGRFGGGGVRGGVGPGGTPVAPGPAAEGIARGGAGSAAAAARGGGPMGGAMGGAGARGQGAEDDEHQRPSYLIEQDEDALIGRLDPVAPPVLGRPQWHPEYQDDES